MRGLGRACRNKRITRGACRNKRITRGREYKEEGGVGVWVVGWGGGRRGCEEDENGDGNDEEDGERA